MTWAHSSTNLFFLPSPLAQDTLGHVCPSVRGRQASVPSVLPQKSQ